MRLNIGDKLVCILKDVNDLTYGKTYEVIYVRDLSYSDDICILDDNNTNWWFEQIRDTGSINDYVGGWQCWTMWFVTEKEWNRDQKIDKLFSK